MRTLSRPAPPFRLELLILGDHPHFPVYPALPAPAACGVNTRQEGTGQGPHFAAPRRLQSANGPRCRKGFGRSLEAGDVLCWDCLFLETPNHNQVVWLYIVLLLNPSQAGSLVTSYRVVPRWTMVVRKPGARLLYTSCPMRETTHSISTNTHDYTRTHAHSHTFTNCNLTVSLYSTPTLAVQPSSHVGIAAAADEHYQVWHPPTALLLRRNYCFAYLKFGRVF